MKIAVVSTILHYPWGGADALWTRAAEAASARGDQLLLALAPSTAGHPRVAALRAAGAAYFARELPRPLTRLDRVRRKLGLLADDATALTRALLDFAPDLVVFSQGGTYDLLLYLDLVAKLRRAGIRYRVIANWQQENPTLPTTDIEIVRPLLEAADAVFFLSPRNLAVTRRHLLSPLTNAAVAHTPLRWQPTDTSPWPAPGPARLATLSRLDDIKGLHLLLHALAELGSSVPDWRLTLHGDGPAATYLHRTVAHLGLVDRVRFAGHVADLRAIWSDHELFCSPALDEGVPMTIPEAMLCQRPVLATCVGGAEDWLSDNETGFLCPAPTLPLLVETLRRAFAARDRWPAMGAAAAARAAAHYRTADHQLVIA